MLKRLFKLKLGLPEARARNDFVRPWKIVDDNGQTCKKNFEIEQEKNFLVTRPTMLAMGYSPQNVVSTLSVPLTAASYWNEDARKMKYVELVYKLRRWVRFFDDGVLLTDLLASTPRIHLQFHVFIPSFFNMVPHLELHAENVYGR